MSDRRGWWARQVVPRLAHAALAHEPVTTLRRRTTAGLRGRVLELGYGSGLNTDLLPSAVTALDAVDPSDVAWEMATQVRARAPVPVTRVGLRGERLASADASYDAVLVTFALCTVADPATVLTEARRVLRPGAALHFLEHGLAPDARTARWQHRLDRVQQVVADGCHLTRDAPALVTAAGFEVVEVDRHHLGGVGALAHLTRGRALAP